MRAHIRNLAKFGVIADVEAYSLPTEAWSYGGNVRFRDGAVVSAPVFRSIVELAEAQPYFVGSHLPSDGVSSVFIGYSSGRIYRYTSAGEVDNSLAGFVDTPSDGVWTETHLADLYYVNREDRVPWVFDPDADEFIELANWDSTWRTRLLRTCGSALVALNVTKNGVHVPNMVITSSIPDAGTVPASWDHTDLSTLATEDILAELKGPIVDASRLGEHLYIYGYNETFRMVADGSSFVFSKKPVFRSRGAINANCSVEAEGKNYVFGPTDIWMHDDVSDNSIIEGFNRDFVFNKLDFTQATRCFVKYYPKLREIRFHYPGGGDRAAFLNYDGCNRCAVYSLANKTWSFDDLPFVYAAGEGHLDSSLTYETVPAASTYETFGGSYADLNESIKNSFLYVGVANTEYGLSASLYAFDPYGEGSSVNADVDENATARRLLQRDGIDLDELEKDLSGYATISEVYPQGRLDAGASGLEIEVGAADYFGQDVTWNAAQDYDNSTNYKIDANVAGRYLALRITHNDYRNFKLSGFDLEIVEEGGR
jgi:hypothetical protein